MHTDVHGNKTHCVSRLLSTAKKVGQGNDWWSLILHLIGRSEVHWRCATDCCCMIIRLWFQGPCRTRQSRKFMRLIREYRDVEQESFHLYGVQVWVSRLLKQCNNVPSVPRTQLLTRSHWWFCNYQSTHGTNLFEIDGIHYFLIVDYFSISVIQLISTTSAAVIRAPKSVFSRHGIPETVRSDKGPQ